MTTLIQIVPQGSIAIVDKTPAEIEDFEIDWSTRGLGTDTISTSAWSTSSPDQLLTTAQAPTITGAITAVWLSGGIADAAYIVTNTIITNGGRTLQESFVCSCIPYRFITN